MRNLRIGLDPWLGCGQGHILPMVVHEFLSLQNISTLDQSDDPNNTNFWQHGWKSGPHLNLNEDMVDHWNRFTKALRSYHIHLIDHDDELVWDFDPSGSYFLKVGYIHLSVDVFNREVKWWCCLWKMKFPSKSNLLVWVILENKAPTWNILQRHIFHGLGWCSLCHNDVESLSHLFLSCP